MFMEGGHQTVEVLTGGGISDDSHTFWSCLDYFYSVYVSFLKIILFICFGLYWVFVAAWVFL